MARFGWLKKTNTGTEIEAASKAPEPARPPGPHTPPAYPTSEKFGLNCFCAQHDRPYQLVFVRQPSGRLHFIESVKVTADATGSSSARSTTARQIIAIDDFEDEDPPCAWCGSGGFNHCANDCGALVCGGRMVGNLFRCRDSCGAEWKGVPMRNVETSREETRSAHSRSASPVARGPALPVDTASRALVVRK
jgi:hypothetical protein